MLGKYFLIWIPRFSIVSLFMANLVLLGCETKETTERDEIQKTASSIMPQVRACKCADTSNFKKIKGRVVYTWSISKEGDVFDIKMDSSELKSAPVERCILEVIKKKKFTEADSESYRIVTYPFFLKGYQVGSESECTKK